MAEQTKNMLIGVFVILACAIIVWLILFLKPGVGDGKQLVLVRFSNINRINVGTRVFFAGKPVGEVVAIDEIYDARKKPMLDDTGNIYYYQLELRIDSSVKVYSTDEITLQTSGLLGEKSITILPKIPPKGIIPQPIKNQPLYAQSLDPIENVFTQLTELSTEMQKTFSKIHEWLAVNGDELGSAVTSFKNTMDEIQTTAQTVNTTKVIPDLQTLVRNTSQTVTEAQKALRQMTEGQVFTNAGVVMENLKNASRSLEQAGKDIATGTGTLGKLIAGDDLYMRMTTITSKVDTLMNDINHYGILFHLNKTWQRQRAQKITELNALNTPQNFKKYFTNEVGEIHTAMARISMLIDRAEILPEKNQILSDEQFRRDFVELLRQSEELSNNLRLYNQQLTQAIE